MGKKDPYEFLGDRVFAMAAIFLIREDFPKMNKYNISNRFINTLGFG